MNDSSLQYGLNRIVVKVPSNASPSLIPLSIKEDGTMVAGIGDGKVSYHFLQPTTTYKPNVVGDRSKKEIRQAINNGKLIYIKTYIPPGKKAYVAVVRDNGRVTQIFDTYFSPTTTKGGKRQIGWGILNSERLNGLTPDMRRMVQTGYMSEARAHFILKEGEAKERKRKSRCKHENNRHKNMAWINYNFTIVPVSGDGSCMYHAVGYGIPKLRKKYFLRNTLTGEKSEDMNRDMMAGHTTESLYTGNRGTMRENLANRIRHDPVFKDIFKDILRTKNLSIYLTKLMNDEYADELEIKMLALNKGIQINVFDLKNDVVQEFVYNEGAGSTVNVIRRDGNHYDALVPKIRPNNTCIIS